MSYIRNAKFKVPKEDKTRSKILTTALEINCLDEAKHLLSHYDSMYIKYKHDPISCERLAENLLQELANIDLQLVAWLFDENNEIRVNNKVIMKLVDDGK